MIRWALQGRSWVTSQSLPVWVCSPSFALQQSSLTKYRGCRKTFREVMEEAGRGDERIWLSQSSGQNYLHPSAGHQAIFLRWHSPSQDTKEAPIAVAQTVPQISLILTSKNSTKSALQNFPSLFLPSIFSIILHSIFLLFWLTHCLHLYFSALVPLSLTSREGQL